MKTNQWFSKRLVFAAAFVGLLLPVQQFSSAWQQPSHGTVTRFVNPDQIESCNPKVSPGLVRWNSTFEDACLSAGLTGKPVLLFQVLGRLDDRFC